MQGRVLDDAALPHPFAPDLELRLDQGHQEGAVGGEGQWLCKHRFQADEAGVADDGVDGLRDIIAGQVAGVGLVHDDDAFV